MNELFWLGGAAGAVTAIILAARQIAGVCREIFRDLADRALVRIAAATREALEPELSTVHAELRVNGGASVKDVTARADRNVAALTAKVDEFTDYQRARNHDLLNKISATAGLIQLLHADDLERFGGRLLHRLEQIADHDEAG